MNCKDCNKFKPKKRRTGFGDWDGVCERWDIGRNLYSTECDRIELKEEISILPRAEIKTSNGDVFE